jgi:hypothetical protein
VGIEVRLSEADVAAGKHVRHLVDEAGGADLLVWVVQGGIVSETERKALAAIAEHFKSAPSLLAPAILPVRLGSALAGDESTAALSADGLVVLPPVSVDPKAADPEADGTRLADALRRGLAHARRVKAVRWLERMKAQRNYVGAGKQAASAIGSAVRSIFWRKGA